MSEIHNIYFKEIAPLYEKLSIEEGRQLAIQAQAGDDAARERLIKNHLLLAVRIANEYKNYGVPDLELYQEASVGLCVAVDKFHPERGTAFSTCAQRWIKAQIIRKCMHGNRVVRLPEHVSELQRTDRWKGPNYSQISIDKPNEEGDSLAESIPDKGSKLDPFVNEEDLIRKQKLEIYFKVLNKQERKVISLHFGIGMDFEFTVIDIAEQLELTTTRINQILRSAKKKMQDEHIVQLQLKAAEKAKLALEIVEEPKTE